MFALTSCPIITCDGNSTCLIINPSAINFTLPTVSRTFEKTNNNTTALVKAHRCMAAVVVKMLLIIDVVERRDKRHVMINEVDDDLCMVSAASCFPMSQYGDKVGVLFLNNLMFSKSLVMFD